MKIFKEYLTESKRTYTYTIKSVIPLTDDLMSKMISVLRRYDLVSCSKPKDYMPEMHPLDFNNTNASAVYVVEIITDSSISPYELQTILSPTLQIPDGYLLVRDPNEPMERQNARIVDKKELDDEAERLGLKPASGATYGETHGISANGSSIFGDEYNKRLLQALSDASKESKDQNNTPIDYYWSRDAISGVNGLTRRYGGVAAAIARIEQTYVDDKGRTVVLSNKTIPKA